MKKILSLSVFLLLLSGCANNSGPAPVDNGKGTATPEIISTTSDAVSNNPASQFSLGKWVHAREEDKNNILTYRNDPAYTPPPTRYLAYFVNKGNNLCACSQLAPNDAHYEKDCACIFTVVNNEEIFTLDANTYTVVQMTDKLLRLKLRP